jgi:transposase
LEREAQRNMELIWLTGRLMPDFKTIADFRRDNGTAIQATCRQFVLLCRKLDLFSDAVVGIDGSKFKAVNNRDKNYTPYKLQRRIEQIEASIARYLSAMEAADRQESEVAQAKSVRLKEKIAALREQMQQFQAMEEVVRAAPDGQVSLTDPDARSMATSGKGTGIVGYNAQAAVDAQHHLTIAHEVTNVGNDRAQLSQMAQQARDARPIRVIWPRRYAIRLFQCVALHQSNPERDSGQVMAARLHARHNFSLLAEYPRPAHYGFSGEQFHARISPNNATRLSRMEWLWSLKRA